MDKRYVGIFVVAAIIIAVVALASLEHAVPSKEAGIGQGANTTGGNQTASKPHRVFTVDLNESVGIRSK